MYTRLTRSGGRTYLQIVEGFRAEGKVRQRVVANLGEKTRTRTYRPARTR